MRETDCLCICPMLEPEDLPCLHCEIVECRELADTERMPAVEQAEDAA